MALSPLVALPTCASGTASEGWRTYWMASVGAAFVAAQVALVLGERATGKDRQAFPLVTVLGFLTPLVTFAVGLARFSAHGPHGRALRRKGRARLPGLAENSWGISGEPGIDAAVETPAKVAEGWRKIAAIETASVSAFAHLANELLAVGAPSELVTNAHLDALDEVRHARLCYELANGMDGRELGPAPFPYAVLPRDTQISLSSLAQECIVESCVFESASAMVAEKLLQEPGLDRPIRRVLEIIAYDEARHAQHGWDVVAWCRDRLGAAEFDRTAKKALKVVRESPEMGSVEHEEWSRYGLAGPLLWRQSVEAATRAAVLKLNTPPRKFDPPTCSHPNNCA
jgi:hypothetical protein